MNIEFVEPYRPSRLMWAAAVGPWVLAALLWGTHLYLQRQIEQLRVAQAAQEDAARRAAAAPAPQAPPPPYLQEALEALKRASQPEADALRELEAVAVVGIQLRSIDVNPATSSVTVELEAGTDEALGDYLDQLNAGMSKPLWHVRQLSMSKRLSSADAAPGPSTPAVQQREAILLVTLVRDI